MQKSREIWKFVFLWQKQAVSLDSSVQENYESINMRFLIISKFIETAI